ncbi:MAG: SpoIIE family protein phosphatase [Magnetococcales bacterium]|nr:SpoIIE family protein phosphatase [Magnetococcales bacterium]
MSKKEILTVLAVDDVPENLDVIKGILVPDYRVKSAINGKIALKIAKKQPPDLILLDIMMPEMDGYEVCERLKDSEITKDIPVIFVTAMDSESDELRGFSLGAVDYVTKPISQPVLKARVSSQISLVQAKRELQKQNNKMQFERELVENIVKKLHNDPHFDQRNIRYTVEPLEKTNGDVLFSAFRPDGSQHIMLGDFTGHGLQAAVGGPLIANFFYLRTLDGMGSLELLKEINNTLHKQLPASTFLAAAFVEVSPNRDKFKLWNAALPSQLLVVEGEQKAIHFTSTLTPLGVSTNIPIDDCDWIRLPDNAKLYLYSDGLVEPMNSNEEMFGVNRLEQLLIKTHNNECKFDDVIKEVVDFSKGGVRMDDITLVEMHK